MNYKEEILRMIDLIKEDRNLRYLYILLKKMTAK